MEHGPWKGATEETVRFWS